MPSSTATSAACATSSAPGTGSATSASARSCWQATFGLPEIELEDIWRCTTCGTCPRRLPARRAADRGRRGAPPHRHRVRRLSRLRRAGARVAGAASPRRQPSGRGARERDGAGPRTFPLKPFAEGMEVLYFVGCYYSYDPRHEEGRGRATAKILEKAGVDFGILGRRGELLRREHPQDRRRGGLPQPRPRRTSRRSSTTA